MPERSDWSVPWPDGSWLTWNEATESWEKQDGPPAATAETTQESATDKESPAEKSSAKKTPAKKSASETADTKKAPAPKATGPKTTGKDTPTTRKASKAPAPKEERTVTKTPKATASKDGTSATTASPAGAPSNAASSEQRWSWQPVAGAEGQPVPRQRVTAVPDRSMGSERSTVGRSQESLLPLVAGGAAVGVVAGYFLVNLIR